METEVLILRPRKAKTVLLIIVSLLFVIGGKFMIEDGKQMGWFVSLFFGLCFLVFMVQLIPGASQLKLSEEGFTLTSLFRSHFTKWEDVVSFEEGYIGGKKSVMFNYVESHRKYLVGKNIAKGLSDFEGALPDSYGLKVSELRALMNGRRKKGVKQPWNS